MLELFSRYGSQLLVIVSIITLIVDTVLNYKLNKIKLQQIEERVTDCENTNKIICKSLLAFVNHTITGNGIDTLKEIRDDIQNYIFKEKR